MALGCIALGGGLAGLCPSPGWAGGTSDGVRRPNRYVDSVHTHPTPSNATNSIAPHLAPPTTAAISVEDSSTCRTASRGHTCPGRACMQLLCNGGHRAPLGTQARHTHTKMTHRDRLGTNGTAPLTRSLASVASFSLGAPDTRVLINTCDESCVLPMCSSITSTATCVPARKEKWWTPADGQWVSAVRVRRERWRAARVSVAQLRHLGV